MSVMPCSREGCDTVLCERWSNSFGYICYTCFTELVASGVGTDIETFMASASKLPPEIRPDPYQHFDAVFRGSWVGDA